MKTVFNDDAIDGNDTIDKWIKNVIDYLLQHKTSLLSWFLQSMT